MIILPDLLKLKWPCIGFWDPKPDVILILNFLNCNDSTTAMTLQHHKQVQEILTHARQLCGFCFSNMTTINWIIFLIIKHTQNLTIFVFSNLYCEYDEHALSHTAVSLTKKQNSILSFILNLVSRCWLSNLFTLDSSLKEPNSNLSKNVPSENEPHSLFIRSFEHGVWSLLLSITMWHEECSTCRYFY